MMIIMMMMIINNKIYLNIIIKHSKSTTEHQ